MLRIVTLTLVAAVLAAGCAAPGADVGQAGTTGGEMAGASQPRVVLAHVDSGINPYHAAFRDDSPRAFAHPATYIPGYPADAPALDLTFDAPTLDAALAADADAWAAVDAETLYWIPGTRIVGAISMGAGGTRCPPTCDERPILDDHGHGTMTASRMASGGHSLAPDALVVSVEGLGASSVRWIVEQGWIDVQTNSWLSLAPAPASWVVTDVTSAFADAAAVMPTLAASGNGAAYVLGTAPTPTYVLSTAAPGVILVGAHDNGHVTAWSGAPAHVVADGYGGWHAPHDALDGYADTGVACCSSASSPYAAGGVAALVLEARAILGDPHVGPREGGVLAQGASGVVAKGPLADGDLTLDELRALLFRTATARPTAGPDDGALNWPARGGAPPTQPGGNPYCPTCTTSPARFADLPDAHALWMHRGYGAVDPDSVAQAVAVLRGEADAPARGAEDAFYAADQDARRALTP